jgi:DDE superfamily endonuclease
LWFVSTGCGGLGVAAGGIGGVPNRVVSKPTLEGLPSMPVLPCSLQAVLSLLAPVFTAPSFENFCALVHGFIGRVGEHTITGIWQAARLAGRVHHARAHAFFSRARWSPDQLGLLLLDLLLARFVPDCEPLLFAIDLTVFRRSGRKVHAAWWLYDGEGPSRYRQMRLGNGFVVLGLVLRLPGLGERVWCLPVLFRLWIPGPPARRRRRAPQTRLTQTELARELIELIAARYPDRRIDVIGDGAYAAKTLRQLPAHVTLTTRLQKKAVIYAPPSRRSGPGRPPKKGERIGSVQQLAQAPPPAWERVELPGQGTATVQQLNGLWYSVWGPQPVRVLLVKDRKDTTKLGIAIITTDTHASTAQLLERYAKRWTIEMCFHDAKSITGVGQARNRTPQAVQRTVPFGFLCQTITITWYALHGNPTADIQQARSRAPWYRTKRDPSMTDILTSLRRELIKAEFRRTHHPHHQPQQNPQTPSQHAPHAA